MRGHIWRRGGPAGRSATSTSLAERVARIEGALTGPWRPTNGSPAVRWRPRAGPPVECPWSASGGIGTNTHGALVAAILWCDGGCCIPRNVRAETAQPSQICFGYPGILHQSSLKPDPEISVAVHRDDHLASLAGQGVVATSDSIYDPSSSFQDSYKFPSRNNLHRATCRISGFSVLSVVRWSAYPASM